MDQSVNDFRAWPVSIQALFLTDALKVAFHEDTYVAIDNRRRYVVQHKIVVLCSRHLVKPMSDRYFRPARQKHAQPDCLQRPSLGQELHDESDVVFIITFIERVDDENIRGMAIDV